MLWVQIGGVKQKVLTNTEQRSLMFKEHVNAMCMSGYCRKDNI